MNPILPNEIWAMIVKYKRQDYETAKTFLKQHLKLKPMGTRISGFYGDFLYNLSDEKVVLIFNYNAVTNDRRTISNFQNPRFFYY